MFQYHTQTFNMCS